MNISGIGNSGVTVQQPSFELSRSDTRDNSTAKNTRQTEGTGDGKQAEQKDTEKQKIQQEVQRLKAQEEKVKAHEAAHKSAGGQYASAATYSYRPGPDGRSYIVGGEVQIDMSPGRTPQETIAKMQVVQRAAMAPGDPSGQDRAVAAQAAAMAAQAQQEQLKQASAEQNGENPESTTASSSSSGAGTALEPKGRNSTKSGTAAGENAPAGEDAHPLDTEKTTSAAATNGQDRNNRQISVYKANTTPGDIFAAQQMSAYA